MRTRSVMVCLVAVLFVLPARAEELFPYQAYVVGNEVYVRSGPGRNYYPTDKLKAGIQVEVYRQDPGGWLAIRPPTGSYSWISSRYVDPGEDNLGQVNQDRVVSRVGSRFSNVRDVIQVRLDCDEIVEILDSHNAGGQLWYRITPPSGEFRWIASRYVDQQLPNNGVGQSRTPDRSESLEASGAVKPASMRPNSASQESPPNRDLERKLEELELLLSVMVAEEPTVWKFSELSQETNSLLDQANTAVERGRIRAISHKIEHFQDIKSRYDQVVAIQKKTDRLNPSLANSNGLSSNAPRSVVTKRSQDESRHDGVGTLRPVLARGELAPNYALVNEQGQVVSFVTPGPGLNLHPHLGRKIGVSGTRSYYSKYRRPHVMALRVTPLQQPVLR